MNASTDWQDRRHHALQRALAARVVAQQDVDEGFLYRPGELLLGRGAVDELRAETGSAAAHPDEETNARLAGRGVDVQRWRLRDGIDARALQHTLDGRARSRGSHVELNHVVSGEWVYQGGPAVAPVVAAALPVPQGVALLSASPDLAVLDTGVADPAHAMFAPALLDQLPDEWDLLDEDGDSFLDTEAGHGTFICGLVQRVAPGLALEQRRVLSPDGFGDDLTVALGLAETTAAVVNLSLGGYTRLNRPPRALQHALDALDPSRVVVAAAGNNGHSRPFWPAAFEQVIAVAAFDSADGTTAAFSNYGDWVDVCAPGVDLHSCFVAGRHVADPAAAAFAGWAGWSGTSFAAPLVAAEIARRTTTSPGRTARQVADELLTELGERPDDYGRRYTPVTDVRLR